jgi:hypothetical protein
MSEIYSATRDGRRFGTSANCSRDGSRYGIEYGDNGSKLDLHFYFAQTSMADHITSKLNPDTHLILVRRTKQLL